MTSEREVRLLNARGELLAATFTPAGEDVIGPAVLLCQGLSGVRTLVLPEVAHALASSGISSLRFDYAGFGDSEGELGWIDPITRASDARYALHALLDQPEVDFNRLGVYGHSYGGPVALQVAAAEPLVRALAAISSPGSGTDMLRAARPAWDWVELKQVLARERARIAEGGKPELVGIDTIFPFSPRFAVGYERLKASQGGTSALQAASGLGKDQFYLASIDQMTSLDLERTASTLASCAVLFISGELDDTAPTETLAPIYRALPATKEWVIVPDADHNALDSDPGLSVALSTVTSWFQSNFSDSARSTNSSG